jgi:hypothetical protein
MSNEYRVTLPESRIDYDPQARTDVVHSLRTVLWQGDSFPGESVIDKLVEGQIEKGQSEPLQSAIYMNVEKRRRMKLGWFVVDRINIPGA